MDMVMHSRIINHLIATCRPPTSEELAHAVGARIAAIEGSLLRLASSHSLVLHPHICEIWVAHPFSASPTHTCVKKGQQVWWAPCIWCALGVSNLVGGDTKVHSRIGGESDCIEIEVHNGIVAEDKLWVHFPEPPRFAWDNVHHFCARLLPFRTPEDVQPWAMRHGFHTGQTLHILKVAELARQWYRNHADEKWRKWTNAEAAAIFDKVGLHGEFWSLDTKTGHF